jgi:hypothetical protein
MIFALQAAAAGLLLILSLFGFLACNVLIAYLWAKRRELKESASEWIDQGLGKLEKLAKQYSPTGPEVSLGVFVCAAGYSCVLTLKQPHGIDDVVLLLATAALFLALAVACITRRLVAAILKWLDPASKLLMLTWLSFIAWWGAQDAQLEAASLFAPHTLDLPKTSIVASALNSGVIIVAAMLWFTVAFAVLFLMASQRQVRSRPLLWIGALAVCGFSLFACIGILAAAAKDLRKPILTYFALRYEFDPRPECEPNNRDQRTHRAIVGTKSAMLSVPRPLNQKLTLGQWRARPSPDPLGDPMGLYLVNCSKSTRALDPTAEASAVSREQ